MINGLYGIADADWGDPVVSGSLLARAGCRVIQLRAKGRPDDAIQRTARALLPILHSYGAKLIINDNLAVAVACGADGVHLGQDDGPLSAARAALPPGSLIGRSTHTPEQVMEAQGADYLGFGPVFTTETKDTGYADRGLAALSEAVCLSCRPVVAIGGITLSRLPDVEKTGAAGWAVISAILGARDPLAAAQRFIRP